MSSIYPTPCDEALAEVADYLRRKRVEAELPPASSFVSPGNPPQGKIPLRPSGN